MASCRTTRSGLKLPGCTTTPPREESRDAFAPKSPTIGISPENAGGPTTTGLLNCTSMPSRDSQKSMPSWEGSTVLQISTLPQLASFSIIVFGGTRPPVPTMIGVGVGLPDDRTVTAGEAISVLVNPPAPGRNSFTVPLTLTESPTLTVGAVDVKTKIPSEVASFASGFGSCIQKPFDFFAVTIPGTLDIA